MKCSQSKAFESRMLGIGKDAFHHVSVSLDGGNVRTCPSSSGGKRVGHYHSSPIQTRKGLIRDDVEVVLTGAGACVFTSRAARKRQRTGALHDASECAAVPNLREVLDCASPLALWLQRREAVPVPNRARRLETQMFTVRRTAGCALNLGALTAIGARTATSANRARRDSREHGCPLTEHHRLTASMRRRRCAREHGSLGKPTCIGSDRANPNGGRGKSVRDDVEVALTGAGACVFTSRAARKRQRTGALQDASECRRRARTSARFWSAVAK